MASKRVKFNIKNVHYAKLSFDDSGTPAYGTPTAIPGAVTFSLSPEGDRSVFYADGVEYYVTSQNNGYSGSLEVAEFPESFLTDILKYAKGADGRLTEYADTEPDPFALLFQMDGSPEAVRFVFYNVNASRPGVEAETNTESKTVKTETIDITVSPLDGGAVRSKATESDSAYANFFNSVTVPTRSAAT